MKIASLDLFAAGGFFERRTGSRSSQLKNGSVERRWRGEAMWEPFSAAADCSASNLRRRLAGWNGVRCF